MMPLLKLMVKLTTSSATEIWCRITTDRAVTASDSWANTPDTDTRQHVVLAYNASETCNVARTPQTCGDGERHTTIQRQGARDAVAAHCQNGQPAGVQVPTARHELAGRLWRRFLGGCIKPGEARAAVAAKQREQRQVRAHRVPAMVKADRDLQLLRVARHAEVRRQCTRMTVHAYLRARLFGSNQV